jgi:hypothetical protein
MSGSIRWFVYRDDADNAWALRADESNTLHANTGAVVDPPTAGFDTLPRGLKPRKAVYVSPDKRVKRECYVLTTAQVAAIPVTMPVTIPDNGAFTLNLVQVKGEERSFINPADTGLIDGTP